MPDGPTMVKKFTHYVQGCMCPNSVAGPSRCLKAICYAMITCGVLIVVTGLFVFNREFTNVFAAFEKQRLESAMVVYGSAVLTALAGLWGILLVNNQRCLQLGMIYGSCLIPLWLIQGVMGLCLYAVAYLKDATLDSFCPTNLDPSRFVFFDQASSIVTGTDERVLKLSSYYMCSDVCPCPLKSDDGLTNYQEYFANVDEETLNIFERTLRDDNDFMQFVFLE